MRNIHTGHHYGVTGNGIVGCNISGGYQTLGGQVHINNSGKPEPAKPSKSNEQSEETNAQLAAMLAHLFASMSKGQEQSRSQFSEQPLNAIQGDYAKAVTNMVAAGKKPIVNHAAGF
ncbi:hypothetical protein BKA70DRAFT_1563241 [Coprinopsis sp. MPI-PUGE-AT-0042]|nr:hypothetical protein BKA70DRAFT_1563241 [Coprinopsis sp. MPI-PUGE-AT-0042]